jgi:hypothetical protein
MLFLFDLQIYYRYNVIDYQRSNPEVNRDRIMFVNNTKRKTRAAKCNSNIHTKCKDCMYSIYNIDSHKHLNRVFRFFLSSLLPHKRRERRFFVLVNHEIDQRKKEV